MRVPLQLLLQGHSCTVCLLGARLLHAKRLRAQRPDHLVDDAVLQRLLGVEVLVPVEVELDLHGDNAHSC